ncbi:hypothetical protein GWI33_017266 [Rhynchophorus ferrugineus]|uniref:Uncharacterized protein n=1 Tax=Rhynchophorus ferrugineus TaxID=354439 RepID=A0A834HZ19_RHYFE|nr:hypothetical protein GWI33_017266 [Rhynchophorus ferrugineus]
MLLLKGSIVFEVCLVLSLTHRGSTQEYDYSSEADSADYGSEYDHSDYGKYSGGRAVALKQKQDTLEYNDGLPNQAEFEKFFVTPIGFDSSGLEEAASSLKPVKTDPFRHLRDAFFQKTSASDYHPLKAERSQVSPGPHYVSHQIPVPATFFKHDDEERASSKDDVETIAPPLKGKGTKSKSDGDFDGFKDAFDSYEQLRKAADEIDYTKGNPSYFNSKDVDYSTGKSSSTVSQNSPSSAAYLSALKIPTSKVNPIEKYNLEPVDYDALQSKYIEELNKEDGAAASSDSAPENLEGCRKIASPEYAENMNCFVCEDAANKAKFTQCSYSASEDPINEYAASSMRFSVPAKAPGSFRFKRSPAKGSYSQDPYFEVASRSKKYYEDFEKEQEAAEIERQKDFEYKPYSPDEYESYSESQSSELLKVPGACQQVEREGATCTVCRDEKTGGNFEQCSYSSAPKEHKYAYVAEKKFDSDDEPKETKTVLKEDSGEQDEGESVVKSKTAEAIPELESAGTSVEETEVSAEDDEAEENEKPESGYEYPYFKYTNTKDNNKKLVDDNPYDVPEHFKANVKNDKSSAEEEDDESFDEYHYKLFPELHKTSESKNEERQSAPAQKKEQDVEEVLAEFAKKDRSNCKKAEKSGMTCFLCVDHNKIQHEECMYIAESKPKATHVAYHEVQRLKDPKKESSDEESEESKVEPLTEKPVDAVVPSASETSKKKKFFKKASASKPVADMGTASSEIMETVLSVQPDFRDMELVAEESAPDSERIEVKQTKAKEEQVAPKEVDVADEEGAYSHETKPIYSKLFDTTLPRYMVEKTEFEKDFDADAGFD